MCPRTSGQKFKPSWLPMLKRLIGRLLFLIQITKGMVDMAVVYATLIIKGVYTFDRVPVAQQQKVREYLAAMDLDIDGTPLPDPVGE